MHLMPTSDAGITDRAGVTLMPAAPATTVDSYNCRRWCIAGRDFRAGDVAQKGGPEDAAVDQIFEHFDGLKSARMRPRPRRSCAIAMGW
jgi:hypothetical protein